MSLVPPGAGRQAPVDFMNHMAATLAAGIVELPAFPQVVIKVQEVLKNPNYTAQMIARPISADPTLAARLLNMANSTAFNATGRVIIDLGVALTRLGAQKVYSVVLAHAVQDIRRTDALRSIGRPLDELWSESVTVAHFCDAVAKRTALPVQEAFVAGLLHRMGHFYILVQCAQRAPSQLGVALTDDLIEAWHPAIAKLVLTNWQMSETVCNSVGAQADVHVLRTGSATLTDVLIVGIRLARRLKNTHDTTTLSQGGVLARLNLSIEECDRLVAESEAEVRALERVLRP